jgi:hypothetical protein
MKRYWIKLKIWWANYTNKNKNSFYAEAGEFLCTGDLVYLDKEGKARRIIK